MVSLLPCSKIVVACSLCLRFPHLKDGFIVLKISVDSCLQRGSRQWLVQGLGPSAFFVASAGQGRAAPPWQPETQAGLHSEHLLLI